MSAATDDGDGRIGFPKWIGYSRAQRILRILDRLLEAHQRPRMPSRLIVGPPTNGKTWLVKHFVNRHPKHDDDEQGSFVVPVLFVNSPPHPDEARLYENILDALNAKYSERARAGEKARQVLHLMRRMRVRMLILDEIHNQLAGPTNKQLVQANVIKTLSNELEIPIVLVGTSLAYNALQIDAQLSSRFPAVELPMWSFDDDFRRLLASLEKLWAIECDPDELGPRLLALSGATIGGICEHLESAALYARDRGTSHIVKSHLEKCDWIMDDPRRRHGARRS